MIVAYFDLVQASGGNAAVQMVLVLPNQHAQAGLHNKGQQCNLAGVPPLSQHTFRLSHPLLLCADVMLFRREGDKSLALKRTISENWALTA